MWDLRMLVIVSAACRRSFLMEEVVSLWRLGEDRVREYRHERRSLKDEFDGTEEADLA